MKRTKIILLSIILITFGASIAVMIKHSFATDEATDITADCTNIICLNVTFLKESAEGVPVTGAKFRLWGTSDDNQTIDLTATSQNGNVTFVNVPVGEYSLKETLSPTGYKLDNITYTVEVGERS